MKSERRIKSSGQLWKVYASFIGILIAGCTMLYGVCIDSEGGNRSIALILSAIAIGDSDRDICLYVHPMPGVWTEMGMVCSFKKRDESMGKLARFI